MFWIISYEKIKSSATKVSVAPLISSRRLLIYFTPLKQSATFSSSAFFFVDNF
jgi:hypothetical protein